MKCDIDVAVVYLKDGTFSLSRFARIIALFSSRPKTLFCLSQPDAVREKLHR